jgi:hypothetical protein
MSGDSNSGWGDSDGQLAQEEIAAAKLHVLHLDPIKAKLGDKWERLSNLVHKLFERTLYQTQGPRDHFLLVDELSYVVTFHNLSLEEAGLACASVARKVCELLFGSDIDDVAVRSLVGPISAALLSGKLGDAARIAEILERRGGEIIVTPESADPGLRTRERSKGRAGTRWQPRGWIRKAHELAGDTGVRSGFFPVWDLKNRTSASLFCSAYSGTGAERNRISVRRAMARSGDARIVGTEIALLNAAAEYAHRVHAGGKVCALGVGVSYETLSGFHSRIQYIGALKAIETIASCPILLRVEQLAPGTPLGRLAEIVAMLGVPNVRMTVEFQSLRTLPELDVRLGVAGLGGSLKGFDGGSVAAAVAKLARRAAEQKAFAWLDDIDTDEMLACAMQNEIRFGSGNAIDRTRSYSGEEPVPDLPLRL